ncbi:hypothetical protein B0A48_03264 [Cryoendolithus antarcticus]|uniref:Autophagy-related protein 9 n=1 Tax=Cryoendolithus antarcticus TaxID=1507870 RepID=A0A1V8TJI9_9PEZI|nr:hypothetical protein B0A48_03264 [Cryoendolithus antarcticus]
MLASRMLSRLLPVTEGDVSVYDSVRQDTGPDLESQERPAMPFRDDDDDPENMMFEGQNAPAPFSDVALSPERRAMSRESGPSSGSRPRRLDPEQRQPADEDDDVPASLLLDEHETPSTRRGEPSTDRRATSRQKTEAQWRATQRQHKLHASQMPRQGQRRSSQAASAGQPGHPVHNNEAADAMWMYTNAANLDGFLREVYQYYTEHGVWSIILSRAIDQLTEIFLFSLTMFLTTCVDYSKIPSSKKTSDVLIPKCMAQAGWIKNAALFAFIIYSCSKALNNLGSLRRLFQMRNFYHHVLGISDADIQTVSWVRVVDGLVRIQNANVATAVNAPRAKRYLEYTKPQQRMNAESIANRLMRKDNYYVALFNKDVVDFSLPVPFLGERQFYSKSLEWCFDFCLTNFIFDEQGTPRPFALGIKNRHALIENVRRRLRFVAIISVILAPWNIIRFCITYFFRYYIEFTRNPAKASARTFTPFAEWKIREFNELDHLFQRRLRQAYPFANEYLKQFPKDKMDQLCRFVAFVSGAFAAVLTLATLFDTELFLTFEITPGRTAVFWLTIMVGIFGVAYGTLPDEYDTHDPVLHLREVLLYTHYMPAHWKDRLHSNEVRAEFATLYQMKILIFLEEILSLVLAPLILLRNANHRSERIVDFFREHTVHVEGIGHQCNFAVFGFKKNQNIEDPTTMLQEPDGLRDDYFGLKDDKMAASVQNFAQYYSHHHHRNGRRALQTYQPPPAWPPMDLGPADDAALPARTPARPHRSTLLDSRRLPTTFSPVQQARDRQSLARLPELQNDSRVSESRLMAQDSDLDDYDKAVGVGGVGESETDKEDEVGREGVLGMLAQFTRAKRKEGRGAVEI